MKYGQIILIDNKLVRKAKNLSISSEKFWSIKQLKPTKAIFLGMRTLSNGERHRTDEGIYYTPKEYLKVALVSINANINPFYTILK